MRNKLITTFILIFLVISTWISYPIFLKKYIIYKASQKGWQLQLNQAKLTHLLDLKLSGITASRKGITADIKSAWIELDLFEPKFLHIEGGSIRIQNIENVKNVKVNNEESKLNIEANNLNITSNICGGVSAQGVFVKRINNEITAQINEIKGKCFEFYGIAKSVNLFEKKLDIKSITAEYQHTIYTKTNEKLQSKININTDLINNIIIHDITINVNNTSLIASNISVIRITRDPSDSQTITGIRFESSTISNDSLESPIEAHNGNIIIEKTKSDEFTIQAGIGKISLKNKALSQNELATKTIAIVSTLSLNHELKSTILTEGAEINTYFKKTDHIEFVAELKETDCNKLINAIPPGMIEQISDFKFAGKIAAKINIDTSPPKPKVKISLKNGCRILKAPASMNVSNFKTKFKRIVPGIDKKPTEIDSGPYSKWWTPLNAITPCLPKAVMVTEDAGFEHHNGFIIAAIENSIVMNIESGKFVRGGSTISMQLAKNLWLSRTKTLSRKLQEFFLTTYLEQSMTKNEIMELYLNMVELGPGIYGVAQASHEYFDKSPISLTLGECLFLSSILPAPRQPRFNVDGILYKQWASYLQTLMKLMYEREYITEDELKIGLTEEIRKGGSKMNSDPQLSITEEGVSPDSWQ